MATASRNARTVPIRTFVGVAAAGYQGAQPVNEVPQPTGPPGSGGNISVIYPDSD
jgi:hypothetical protein